MLKKILTSILIPAFLLQIVGCYSSKEITIADLKNVKENKLIKVETISTSYTLQNPPGKDSYGWSLGKNNIYVYSSGPKNIGNNPIKLVTDTTKIPLSSIKNIYTNGFDTVLTLYCVIGIAAIIWLFYDYFISVANVLKSLQ